MKILLLSIFGFAISVAAVSPPRRSCDFGCTANYNPVCGGPKNGPLKTYSNKCMFNLANCKARQQLKIARECACTEKTCGPKCNNVCTLIFKPVCGGPRGGPYKTYSNKCWFDSANCRSRNKLIIVRESACSAKQCKPKCNKMCPLIMKPVCGGPPGGPFTTYPNKCVFDSANCKSRNKLILYRSTACPKICSDICPMIYQPVCGGPRGGPYRTYGNLCQFTAANCKSKYKLTLLRRSACPRKPDNCNRKCISLWKPVCGGPKGGPYRNYSNICMFNVANCRARNQLILFPRSACPPQPNRCVHPCPRIFRPVCGGPKGGLYRQYSNKCEFDIANCEHRNRWSVVDKSLCKPKCRVACPRNYRPVCGGPVGGPYRTYSNLCVFKAAQCKGPQKLQLLSESACKSTPNKCDRKCPTTFEPVCGGPEGGPIEEFPNKCEFDIANCAIGNKWKIVDNSQCPSSCNDKCPAVYKPICGGPDGGPYTTYSSLCVFRYRQCTSRQVLKVIQNGACPKRPHCSDICTKEYIPICGGIKGQLPRTYGNVCEFNAAQCKDNRIEFIISLACRQQECKKICPLYVMPVCAGPKGGPYKQYSNKCLFDVANCENNNKLQLVSKSLCQQKCDKPCTREYRPVCAGPKGGPYKNYSNKCVFEVENCKARNQLVIFRESACPATPQNCLKPCTREYNPVCGGPKGGPYRNYSTKCVFEVENCKARNQLVIFRESACPPVPQKCEKPCTREYNPVCGGPKGGPYRNYPTKCVFEVENCKARNELVLLQESACPKQPANCNRMCMDLYKPVCGGPKGGPYKNYSNICVFNVANCRARNQLTLLQNSECPVQQNCNRPCSKIYRPVCGGPRGGPYKNYGNKCVFDTENCKARNQLILKRESKCQPEDNCSGICTKIYAPVCGGPKGGPYKTYGNECEFNFENCKTGRKLELTRKSACPTGKSNSGNSASPSNETGSSGSQSQRSSPHSS